MTAADDVRLVVDIEVSRPLYAGDLGCLRFKGRFVYVDPIDGRPRCPQQSDHGNGLAHLADLAITAQRDTVAEGYWYALELEYRDVYSVNLEFAEVMVKTLRRAHRQLERLADRFGRPTDLAGFIGQVGDVMKVSQYGWITQRGRINGPESEYRWGDINVLRLHIDSVVRDATEAKAS